MASAGGIGFAEPLGEAVGGREELKTTAFPEEDAGTRETVFRSEEALPEFAAEGSPGPEEEALWELTEEASEAAGEVAAPELAWEAGGGTEDKVGHSAVVHEDSRSRNVSKTGSILFLPIRSPSLRHRPGFSRPNLKNPTLLGGPPIGSRVRFICPNPPRSIRPRFSVAIHCHLTLCGN